ncbi:MAG: ATP-binding cassette domain-containing protein [Lachnospiraceae bacterium]|jgi:ATPase subunit of ABC transporter with duplicated ATPase domains|nr:ATP-binding cassette domain-containing protein [Lachnospiraceae bacterium]
MISAVNVTLRLGKKALFEDVNIKFTPGNCYGLIGANGAGKSTFLKILSGELEPTKGEIIMDPGERLSILKQDHFQYDAYPVLDTVIMGNQRLYEIMKEKDAIYAKEDFTDEDGVKAAELEGEFANMNGWEAESDAATLLNGLGIDTELHYKQMSELAPALKVKVLLAQALFGNPDVLLLDEPTNHLDLDAIAWLEEFLINFDNTVIVVSHDRYFLNKVCTHTADVDYGKIQLYAGNYDFWYESSQLMIKQQKEANKKKEEKIKELQEFIQRFSANASKSKQATSRKRALEKIELDDIRPSSRKYPYIDFRPNREIGNEVLTVEKMSKTIDGVKVLDNISFTINKGDKVAFVGPNTIATTTLFQILAGEMEPDEGNYKWGVTTSQGYFPKDFTKEFDNDYIIVDWLTQYSEEKDATYVRGFLGRMLFAGEDGVKKVKVLSGGEKVRCLLSKLMIMGSNVLIMDEPTNHLDMESITALNNGMMKFPGVILFSSQDHQLLQTTANRIMELTNTGLIDKQTTYDEYLANDELARKRQVMNMAVTDEEEE